MKDKMQNKRFIDDRMIDGEKPCQNNSILMNYTYLHWSKESGDCCIHIYDVHSSIK